MIKMNMLFRVSPSPIIVISSSTKKRRRFFRLLPVYWAFCPNPYLWFSLPDNLSGDHAALIFPLPVIMPNTVRNK